MAITAEGAVAAPGNGVVIVGGGAGAIHTVESLREVIMFSFFSREIGVSHYVLFLSEWIQGEHYNH